MSTILQSKTTVQSGATLLGMLKHSFAVLAGTAIALASISLPAFVRAEPPGGANGWTLTFQDDFSSNLDTSKWRNTFWWGTGRISDGSLNYYSPNNVSVSNGYLKLKVNNNSEDGKAYTGAVVQTSDKFYQTYGYYEARVKVPNGLGIGPHFTLLGQDKSWPPETAIFEIPGAGGYNATTIWWFNHYLNGYGQRSVEGAVGAWNSGVRLDQDYHTYGLLWQPGLLVWYVDGIERYRTTVAVPNKACYLNLAVGVSSDDYNWVGRPDNTLFPQYMSVDWVRVWKKN